ncbi:MAG: ANTAR domain-containing response regulator [Burkholderiales bacterium]
MEKARITIALANIEAAEKIKNALQRNGYAVDDICTSGSEALRRIRAGSTDILLINFDMPDMTGLEVATIIGDGNLCSVLLFVSNVQREFCTDVVEDYDITLFTKPVSADKLLNTLEVIVQNRRRMCKLERELNKLKRELDDRKVIEKAKGILMKRKGISEAEAYRRIQKMSMDTRVAMRDIAEKILLLAEKSEAQQ